MDQYSETFLALKQKIFLHGSKRLSAWLLKLFRSISRWYFCSILSSGLKSERKQRLFPRSSRWVFGHSSVKFSIDPTLVRNIMIDSSNDLDKVEWQLKVSIARLYQLIRTMLIVNLLQVIRVCIPATKRFEVETWVNDMAQSNPTVFILQVKYFTPKSLYLDLMCISLLSRGGSAQWHRECI